MGAVWGDYDNDGFEDLLLYKYGRPELFRNDEGTSLRARSASAPGCRRGSTPTAPPGSTTTATAGSICSSPATGPTTSISGSSTTTRIMPESFEYATNGGRKYLLRNRGDGTFEDVTAALGITQPPLDAGRGRRRPARHRLSGSLPRQRLRRVGAVRQSAAASASWTWPQTTGVGRTPKSGMNASVGDVFNDGRLAIYKTNISEPGVLVQGNDLWVPRAGGRGRSVSYENLASSLGVDLGGWSWGAQFGDLNNDGTQDLYLVERLRLGRRAQQLLVRLLGDRRRAQHDHRRRRELAGDEGPQPLRLPAEARVAERRPRPLHRRGAGRRRDRHLRRPRRGARRSRQPRRARRHRGQPARDRCSSTATRSTPGGTGSSSSSRARRATAARSARASSCTGRAKAQGQDVRGGQRLQRAEPAAPALRARAPRPRSIASIIRWPSGAADDRRPAVDQLHRVKEPMA